MQDCREEGGGLGSVGSARLASMRLGSARVSLMGRFGLAQLGPDRTKGKEGHGREILTVSSKSRRLLPH